MDLQIDYFLQHHTTTHTRVQHSDLRCSYLSHVDILTYKNHFHPHNLQYHWLLINFNSYFCVFIIILLGIFANFMYSITLTVKGRPLP
jgi:hypothetical protein